MTDYTQIIDGIHGSSSSGHIIDEHEYIIIDSKTRQITLPNEFNSTIAYAGDINSQIVRFICPEEYDGHSLKECSNHEIRWYNTGSGIGDVSQLEVGDNIEGGFILSWLIPPEAATKAGTLQCVISIYDTEDNEMCPVVFSSYKEPYITWNYNSQWKILEVQFSDLPASDNYDYIGFEGYGYTVEFLEDAPGVYFHVSGETYAPDGMSEEYTLEITKGLSRELVDGASYSLMFERDSAYESSSCKITAYKENNSSSDTIKYQWNTAPFISLSIGATLDNVDVKVPTKDKILTLSTQTRNITLPAGYNTTIASQYDIGTTHVYIQAPRYIHNMDLLDSSVGVYCGWHLPESDGIDRCQVTKQYSLLETDDLVLITWDVDQDLITNCNGNFSFELSVKQFNQPIGDEDTKLIKQWYSNINTALSIKPTLNIPQDLAPSEGLAEGVLVEAAVDLNDIEQLINEELYTGGTTI